MPLILYTDFNHDLRNELLNKPDSWYSKKAKESNLNVIYSNNPSEYTRKQSLNNRQNTSYIDYFWSKDVTRGLGSRGVASKTCTGNARSPRDHTSAGKDQQFMFSLESYLGVPMV